MLTDEELGRLDELANDGEWVPGRRFRDALAELREQRKASRWVLTAERKPSLTSPDGRHWSMVKVEVWTGDPSDDMSGPDTYFYDLSGGWSRRGSLDVAPVPKWWRPIQLPAPPKEAGE